MTDVESPSRSTPGDELLRRTGFHTILSHADEVSRTIADAHRQLRSLEREEALGIPTTTDRSMVDRNIGLARRNAAEARRALRRQLSGDIWKGLKRDVGGRKGELDASLAEARSRWVEAVRRSDLPAGDAVEGVRIFDVAAEKLRNGGVDEIFSHLDNHFAEFERVLTDEEDFGRRAHSPLEWWQWLLIAIAVAVAIAVIVACIIWHGCVWILALFRALCIFEFVRWYGPCVQIPF